MAELREASGELTIKLLMREMKVNDDQLKSRVEESDLPELAACFDNTEDYVEKLQLSPGQQTDVNEVKATALLNRTQTGIKVALKYWRNRNPIEATFKALLLILLSLTKGDVAIQVCKYLSCKHGSYSTVDNITTTEVFNELPKSGLSRKRKREAPSPVILKRTFPNISLCYQSEAEIKPILSKLFLESSNLSCKFATLYCSLCSSLEERNVSKTRLVACVIGLETFPPIYEKSSQPLFKDQQSNLLAATDIASIWIILKNYCSYFNYYIVEHITNQLGTEDDKQQMSSYKKAFIEYVKRRVYKCPVEFGSMNDDDCTIVVKLDKTYDDCTADQLIILTEKLCEILKLSDGILRLCNVEKGCYELTYQAPAFIQDRVFPLSREQESALKNLKIVWLLCGDYEFSSHQDNADDSYDSDSEDDKHDDDDYPDDISQVTSLLESIGGSAQLSKMSSSSKSDSGVGKSTLNTETKSSLTEFTEDVFDYPFIESELVPQNEQPALLELMPSALVVAAYTGDHLQVKYCVEVLQCNPLLLDNHGNTALHTSTNGENLKILKYFMEEQKFSLVTPSLSGMSCLHLAALNGSLPIVKYFIESVEADPLLQDSHQKTPLHYACQNGSIEVFNYLLTQAKHHDSLKAILYDKTQLGSTMLHFAASSGNCKLLDLLVDEYRLDPDIPGQLGATPLLVAAQEGHLHVVKHLVAKNCNKNITLDKVKQNILHIASRKGHYELVKFLKSWNFLNPDAKDSVGCTPLHLASQKGYVEIVQCLIEEYASNPMCLTKKRFTPLHCAASEGHVNVVKFLISEKNIDPHAQCIHISPLKLAVEAGKVDVIEYYLDTLNSNIDYPFRMGERLLFIAVHHGYLQIVKKFMKSQKWTRTSTGFRQNLLLHKATTLGYLGILEYFFHECNWEYLEDISGESLLNRAVANGHLNIVKFLILEVGYDPNLGDNVTNTPLDTACLNGHLQIVEFLWNECSLNRLVVGKDKFSPLHLAAIGGHIYIVQYLVENQIIHPLCEMAISGAIPLHSAVSAGKLEVVKYFIFETSINPNYSLKQGLSPLHLACMSGDKVIVNFLLELSDCCPQQLDKHGNTPLEYAVKLGHLDIVLLMAKNEKCLPMFKGEQMHKIFHTAATFGRLEIIKYFISQHSYNPNTPRCSDKTPFLPAGPYIPGFALKTSLETACSTGQENVARYFIFNCKCPIEPNVNGMTLLHIAAGNGQVKIMEFLINEIHMDPLIRSNSGFTPLHYAVLLEMLEAAKFLINTVGCDPNIRDYDGVSPIHGAAGNRLNLIRDGLSEGDITAFKYFINELKCDPTISSNIGRNALHSAAEQGDLQIVVFLASVFKRYHCDVLTPDNDGETPLHIACRSGKIEVVRYLLLKSSKEVVEVRDKLQKSPLHHAAIGGKLNTANFLVLNARHDPCCTDNKGYTPLHTAADHGHAGMVEWFVTDLCLDPNSQTNFRLSYSVFHVACLQGRETVVRYLISLKQCNKMCVDQINYTGLHYAVLNGHSNIVKLLCVGRHCDILHKGLDGNTPLHCAIIKNHIECLKILISALKKQQKFPKTIWEMLLTLVCSSGNLEMLIYLFKESRKYRIDYKEVLHHAISSCKIDTVKFLLTENPESLVSKDKSGNSLLHKAATTGSVDLVNILLDKFSMDPKCQNLQGITPLHFACLHGNHTVVEQLASQYKNIFDFEGRTPLHFAAIGGHLHIIKMLIAKKVYSNLCFHKDQKGYTPCHSALRQGLMYIVDFFINELKQDSAPVFWHCGVNESFLYFVSMVRGTVCTAQLALHRAAFNGHKEAVKYLIEKESYNPNCQDSLRRTPLHHAAMAGNSEIVKYLVVNAKSNVRAEDIFHNLPLHYAAARGSTGLALSLIEHGSPCTNEGTFNWTPYDMAEAGGHSMLQMLLKILMDPGLDLKMFFDTYTACTQ